jgi:hypothetical protein
MPSYGERQYSAERSNYSNLKSLAPPGGQTSINIFGSGYDDGANGRNSPNRMGAKGRNGEVSASSYKVGQMVGQDHRGYEQKPSLNQHDTN